MTPFSNTVCSPVENILCVSLCEQASLNHYRKKPYKLLEALHYFILCIYVATSILFMHFLCITYAGRLHNVHKLDQQEKKIDMWQHI